jgi:hypothetical protein
VRVKICHKEAGDEVLTQGSGNTDNIVGGEQASGIVTGELP